MGSRVSIISSAEETAREVAEILQRRGQIAEKDGLPTRRFATTGDPGEFERLGSRVFGAGTGPVERVSLEHLMTLAPHMSPAGVEDSTEETACA
jgi:glutamate racemase